MERVKPAHLAPTCGAARKTGMAAITTHARRVDCNGAIVASAISMTVETLTTIRSGVCALWAQAAAEVDLCHPLGAVEGVTRAQYVHRFDVALDAIEAAGDPSRDVRGMTWEADVGDDAGKIARWGAERIVDAAMAKYAV